MQDPSQAPQMIGTDPPPGFSSYVIHFQSMDCYVRNALPTCAEMGGSYGMNYLQISASLPLVDFSFFQLFPAVMIGPFLHLLWFGCVLSKGTINTPLCYPVLSDPSCSSEASRPQSASFTRKRGREREREMNSSLEGIFEVRKLLNTSHPEEPFPLPLHISPSTTLKY